MRILVWLRLAAALLMVIQVTTVSAADLEAGIAAYQTKDYAKAWAILKPLAERGETEAQRKLAVMYRHGLGVKANDKKAIFWYRRAAEGGHQRAQNSLGVMYRFGMGVNKDINEAVYWLTKAARGGYAKAQENLGLLYVERGQDGTPDYKSAVIWLGMAAVQGQSRSQAALGMLYLAGKGVAKDNLKGMEYIRQAAMNGHKKAQLAMVRAYEQGLYGFHKNNEMAKHWREFAGLKSD